MEPAGGGRVLFGGGRVLFGGGRVLLGGGRVLGAGGGGDYPVATSRTYPENTTPPLEGPAFTVGVIDTGLVLEDGAPHPWFAGHVSYHHTDDVDELGRGEDAPAGRVSVSSTAPTAITLSKAAG